MNYLLINTANEELVLAIIKDNQVFFKKDSSLKRHNESLLPYLKELLNQAQIELKDIDEFGVVVGPGSFTGIRVGIATVKAFKDVFKKPVRAINNLNLLHEIVLANGLNIQTVAIEGSLNSYFIGCEIDGKLKIYERNLTLDELQTVSNGLDVGMYSNSHQLQSGVVVEFSIDAFVKAFFNSNSYDLTPIYYQLSQAENDKISKGELVIDEAEVWDIKDITLIENNSFTNCWTEEELNKAFMSKLNNIFVARMDGAVVGFIIAENNIDEINISKVAVDKNYRNHGIGSQLVEAVEKFTKEKNIDCVSLEVSENNFTAKTLYEKLGYNKRRVRKGYYRDGSDAIEMVKKV